MGLLFNPRLRCPTQPVPTLMSGLLWVCVTSIAGPHGGAQLYER
jgi:hypothetical protein